MTEVLGYTKYGAQGGDLGSRITLHLGRTYPDSLLGMHFNTVSNVFPPPPETEQTPEERAWRRAVADYISTEMDHNGEQRNKPQTVALALSANPVGAAAWIVEKLKV
jgi:hypothetical protein